ncbi:MAG: hypothetical protein PHU14_05420 [Methylovulum sp.]|nr:hypothetical protein [Methylovulum sp.]
MNKFIILLAGLCLGLGVGATANADINTVTPSDTFTYNTRQTVTVDIQVNTPTGEATGLSFYSKGADGLRLLDSRTLDGNGSYQGKLMVPAYLKTIVVRSRWLDNFQELDLDVSGRQINAVIDHF